MVFMARQKTKNRSGFISIKANLKLFKQILAIIFTQCVDSGLCRHYLHAVGTRVYGVLTTP